VNLASPIHVRISALGEMTRVGRLMKLVEESAERRAPIVRLADRIAGVFVVVVLALAAITAGIWLALDAGRAVPNAMALLIVTCPCALGLATPLAIIAGIGRAAANGILIKGGWRSLIGEAMHHSNQSSHRSSERRHTRLQKPWRQWMHLKLSAALTFRNRSAVGCRQMSKVSRSSLVRCRSCVTTELKFQHGL
jgi:hypothetical protein